MPESFRTIYNWLLILLSVSILVCVSLVGTVGHAQTVGRVEDPAQAAIEAEIVALARQHMSEVDLNSLQPCGGIANGRYEGTSCAGRWYLLHEGRHFDIGKGKKVDLWKLTSKKSHPDGYLFWEFIIVGVDGKLSILNRVLGENCWENSLDLCLYETTLDSARVSPDGKSGLALSIETSRSVNPNEDPSGLGRGLFKIRFEFGPKGWVERWRSKRLPVRTPDQGVAVFPRST
jgi:hypothetical protein